MSDIYPCQDICPVECINEDADGFLRIDTEECVMCEGCTAVCPIDPFEMTAEDKLQIRVELCYAEENNGNGECKSM